MVYCYIVPFSNIALQDKCVGFRSPVIEKTNILKLVSITKTAKLDLLLVKRHHSGQKQMPPPAFKSELRRFLEFEHSEVLEVLETDIFLNKKFYVKVETIFVS